MNLKGLNILHLPRHGRGEASACVFCYFHFFLLRTHLNLILKLYKSERHVYTL